jgi:hypothetical protein
MSEVFNSRKNKRFTLGDDMEDDTIIGRLLIVKHSDEDLKLQREGILGVSDTLFLKDILERRCQDNSDLLPLIESVGQIDLTYVALPWNAN